MKGTVVSVTPGIAALSNEDAAAIKASQLSGTSKIWRTIARPDAESAVAFVNTPPVQQGGEVSFASLPNGVRPGLLLSVVDRIVGETECDAKASRFVC
jgi:hypothetical protein